MRLAIVTHNVIRGDGQGRVNYEIVRLGLQHGVKVTLVADRIEPDLPDLGAAWVPVRPRRRRPNLLKVREFVRQANAALDRMAGQFDVVHGNGFVLTRGHHVNTSHFVHGAWLRSPVHTSRLRRDAYGAYQWVYTASNARWELQAYQQARVIAAVSERVRRELLAVGVPSDRIRVIANGVDVEEFHPGIADRQATGLPRGVPLALFVGDIRTPLKNLDTVLKAIARAPDVCLAVAGDSQGSPYPKMAADLGIGQRVRFLGFRHDVPELMRAADVSVCPSRSEASSLVLLEAMASGLPVVTARTVGAAELVSPECGVVLDDPDDPGPLAAALCAILGDASRRARMGAAARAIASQYSWAHMARQYLRLYDEVTS